MHRAARVWTHRDASEAGMLPQYESRAYARDVGAHTRGEWKPRGADEHHLEEMKRLEARQPPNTRNAWLRRREQNCLRAGMWAFNAVPWIPELTLSIAEWDIAWRLTLGGMSAEIRARIDAPIGGFANRGRKLELALMRAIDECLPSGTVKTWAQPSPFVIPPDHRERCARDKCTVDGWRRADVAADCRTGKVLVMDVRTVHLQAASALSGHSSAAGHISSIEAAKRNKYAAYYPRAFHPFVISISGAVPESSYGVLKKVAIESAKAAGPRLNWEQYRWAVQMMQWMAVSMVRAVAWDATRTLAKTDVVGCWADQRDPDAAGPPPAQRVFVPRPPVATPAPSSRAAADPLPAEFVLRPPADLSSVPVFLTS